jgi:hypothetical protein
MYIRLRPNIFTLKEALALLGSFNLTSVTGGTIGLGGPESDGEVLFSPYQSP